MTRRLPPNRIALSPLERRAAEQARETLAGIVPSLPPSELRRSLHGALCAAVRALAVSQSIPGRAIHRRQMTQEEG